MMSMQYIEVIDNFRKFGYKIVLRGKYSFIVGNSGTGKSRFVGLLEDYNVQELSGESRGISLNISKSRFIIATVEILEFLWQYDNCIIVVDEDMVWMLRKYSSELQKSNNYFIFINRDLLGNIPIGIYDLYQMTYRRENGFLINYNELLADFIEERIKPDIILTEDSKSGYKFFSKTLNVDCVSTNGKTRVYKKILDCLRSVKGDILVVVDEVGFGYEFYKIYKKMYQGDTDFSRVYFWCPKSFEYCLLNSGRFVDVDDVVADPYNSWDLIKYPTVEKYIESVLKSVDVLYRKGFDVTERYSAYVKTIYKNNFDNYDELVRKEYL